VNSFKIRLLSILSLSLLLQSTALHAFLDVVYGQPLDNQHKELVQNTAKEIADLGKKTDATLQVLAQIEKNQNRSLMQMPTVNASPLIQAFNRVWHRMGNVAVDAQLAVIPTLERHPYATTSLALAIVAVLCSSYSARFDKRSKQDKESLSAQTINFMVGTTGFVAFLGAICFAGKGLHSSACSLLTKSK